MLCPTLCVLMCVCVRACIDPSVVVVDRVELWQHKSCPLLGVEPARKQNGTHLRSTHSGFYQSLYFYLRFPTLTCVPPSPPHYHPTHNSPSTFYPVTFRIFPSIPRLSCFVAALTLLCPTLPLIAVSFTLFFLSPSDTHRIPGD